MNRIFRKFIRLLSERYSQSRDFVNMSSLSPEERTFYFLFKGNGYIHGKKD